MSKLSNLAKQQLASLKAMPRVERESFVGAFNAIDPEVYADMLERYGVTHLTQDPVTIAAFSSGTRPGRPPSERVIGRDVHGGEILIIDYEFDGERAIDLQTDGRIRLTPKLARVIARNLDKWAAAERQATKGGPA